MQDDDVLEAGSKPGKLDDGFEVEVVIAVGTLGGADKLYAVQTGRGCELHLVWIRDAP
jgi:hypothetical protein